MGNVIIKLPAGGGGGVDLSDANAVPADVASGKIFYNNEGRQTGTYTLNSALSDADATPAQVRKGYVFYNKNGRQTGTFDMSDATANSSDVMSGKTFYKNWSKYTGNFSMSDATATASDVLSGKTFYNGSGKVTGAYVKKFSESTLVLTAGKSYSRYLNATGNVSIIKMKNATSATYSTSANQANYYTLDLSGMSLYDFFVSGNTKMVGADVDGVFYSLPIPGGIDLSDVGNTTINYFNTLASILVPPNSEIALFLMYGANRTTGSLGILETSTLGSVASSNFTPRSTHTITAYTRNS